MSDSALLDLLRRAQTGDAKAYGELYEMHVDRIFAYVFGKLRSRPDAEDIVEQVFLQAWQSIERYDAESGSFAGWLFRIAHNLMVDHFRRAGRVRMVEFQDQMVRDTAPSPEDRMVRQAVAGELHEAIGGLTQEQRQVIVLKFFSGKSNRDIADQLGKSEGSIKALQHRALRSLGRLLVEGEK